MAQACLLSSSFIPDPDMKNHRRSMLYSAVLFLAFSVAACGGGSGSNSNASSDNSASAPTDVPTVPKDVPTAQSVIDQSNYVQTAAHAYLAPQSLTGLTRLNDFLASGVSVETNVPGLVELATDVLRQLVDNQGSMVTAVAQLNSCPKGGWVKMSSSGDSLTTLKPGDVVAVETNDCGVSALKINGGFTMTLKEGSATSLQPGTSHGVVQFQFSGLSLANKTETTLIDGDLTARTDENAAGIGTVVLSGASLRTTLKNGSAVVRDRTMSGFESTIITTPGDQTSSVNYTLTASSASVKDLHVVVKTVQPFLYQIVNNPVSGSMLVTGAASSVAVTAVDADNVRLDFSSRGDGAITDTRTISWSEFQKSL
jgi:hypothetical protein